MFSIAEKPTRRVFMGTAAGIVLAGGVIVAMTSGGEEGSHSIMPPEGGTWDFGASAGRTWSNFKNDHPHRATVNGHNFVDSGCVAGGEWARAEAESKWITIRKNEQDKALCN